MKKKETKMMLTIDNIKNCTGCGACQNICPHKAISMRPNNEGFLYPVIDNDKCTNCGICFARCPSENPQYTNSDKPECIGHNRSFLKKRRTLKLVCADCSLLCRL